MAGGTLHRTPGRLLRLLALFRRPVALLVGLAVLTARRLAPAHLAVALPAGRRAVVVAGNLHAAAVVAPLGVLAVYVGAAVARGRDAAAVDAHGAGLLAGLPRLAPGPIAPAAALLAAHLYTHFSWLAKLAGIRGYFALAIVAEAALLTV